MSLLRIARSELSSTHAVNEFPSGYRPAVRRKCGHSTLVCTMHIEMNERLGYRSDRGLTARMLGSAVIFQFTS